MRFLTLAGALWLVLLAEPPTTAAAVPESAAATPVVLFAPSYGDLDERQQQALRTAVQEGARAEHSVLVPQETLAAVARQQAADCLTRPKCQLDVAAAAQAQLLLRLERPAAGPPPVGGPCLRGEVIDVQTGQSALRDEQVCGSGVEQLLEAAQQLTRRLISGAAKLARGTVMVTSQPDAAQVFIDGQARGLTPWEGPSLPGLREVRVEKPDYQAQRDQVTVVAEQAVSVQLTLTPSPSGPAAASLLPPPLPVPVERLRRPRWRLISGGIALGVGVVIAGLGFAGVAQPAACVDPSPTAASSCSGVPLTASLGAAGVAVGLAVAGVGGALIAAPARVQK